MIKSDLIAEETNHKNKVEENEASGDESYDTGPKEPSPFDRTIGHIEDILVDAEFQKMQCDFLNKYWHIFEEDEENKLIYTEVFKQYVCAMENFIEDHLKRVSQDFDLEEFLHQVRERRPVLEGEVFEMLLSLSDFLCFKEMMLDYRAVKEGKTVDLSGDLLITAIPFQD